MKASDANKVISVLLSVAMCPMMVPSAAFAADDDAASDASSPSEQTQPAEQAEGVDAGASLSDTIAPQSEAADASTDEAAPVAKANGEGVQAPTAEEGAEAAVAEVNSKTYSSLQAAINAAPRKATVKLLADTKENVTISTSYVTLDLNGHTLNGSTGERKPALTVTARITVMDSSETQTGTIMREDTAENSGVSSHYVIDVQGSGWLTFESGNVKNDSGAGGTKGASLVRVGDDSIAKYPGLNIEGGTFTQDNFIVIKVDRGDLFLNGGTLNSANSYAIENWFRATVKGGTVNGNVSTWTYNGSGSSLEISGGTVNGNVESVTYDGVEGKPAKVSITGGTVNGTLNTVDYSTGTTSNDPTKATIEVTSGTFSTDPSRYLIEGSAATPNGDGTFGVEKAYLAQVGDNSYYTMDEAFKAQTASGEAITLLRDYTTGSTFNSGSIARVVDLNGHTWTCTGTDANSAAFEINYPNASLTVKNGKVVSSQLIGLIPSASGGTITYDNSSLTFEGVEASTTATSGIETNGNNTNDTVVLKDSTLNVPNGFGIYFPSSGTLTIDNSTINAKTMGAQVCSGNLNVNAGSTITVSGDPVEKAENDGAIQDGAAISIVNRPGYKGLGQIAITGGTFTAKGDNAAIKAYTWDSSTKQESAFDNSAKTVAVSGGTFSSAVSADLCAEGCTPIANTNGTHSVASGVAYVAGKGFDTLQAAIDAAQDGETVTLLTDATEDATIAAGKNITLDLGGKTLTNTNVGKATLTIAKGATATVKNGSIVGGTGYYTIDSYGTATLEDVTATAGNTDASMIRNDGTLTIESGSYSGGLNVVKSEEDSTLNINGGRFELSYATSGYTGVVFAYGNTTITGGEFVQSLTTTGRWNHPQVIATGMVEGHPSFTKITGGTFTNKYSDGSNIFRGVGKGTSDNFEVSGGTFNKSVPSSYFADGLTCAKNADGTYGIATAIAQIGTDRYTSLKAAISAAKKGKTIQLLNDTTENITINASKQITLDLNGHTLNGGTGTAKAAILNKGNVTITDTSANKTGTIKRDDQGIEGETSYYVIKNIGTMVIDQANVANNSGYKKANSSGSMVGSSLICNGDDDPQASLTINGGTFNQPNFLVVKNGTNGTLTVNGGTLTSNHSAVQNWNKAQILGGSLTGQIWTDAWVEGAIGETVIGGDAQFTGEIVVDITGEVPPTLKIEGGSLNVTSWRVTSAAAAANATVAVSGGTFTAAVPKNYCAEGYAPAANADGTYGVKLAEGAYLLQDYRNGDQTSWTYPAKEGMAFAGWYKDASFTTACTAGDVEGAAYAKFVPITDLLQYKGGSLRMDVAQPSELTWLRFGYTMALPEGASFVENGWYFKKVSTSQPTDVRRSANNNVLNIDGTITANLVFTGVTTNYYSANFSEKAFVKYVTADGTTVEAVESDYQVNSVLGVADAILAHPMASKAEKDYATQIKAAV
ncbi:beta strand repeat-containing protein [Ellagibacter isourolithinifaciens]|uniref:beta strand repeat-containing protein n=1 Tax=Ellagibacter isourolithinifaciens TaxID=2137581 RepID=UPI003AEF385D